MLFGMVLRDFQKPDPITITHSESVHLGHLVVATESVPYVCVVQERENVQLVHAHRALERVDERAPGHVDVGHDCDLWFHVVSVVVGSLHVGHGHRLQGQLFRYEHARFHVVGVRRSENRNVQFVCRI